MVGRPDQPRQFWHNDSGSEPHEHIESSSNRSESCNASPSTVIINFLIDTEMYKAECVTVTHTGGKLHKLKLQKGKGKGNQPPNYFHLPIEPFLTEVSLYKLIILFHIGIGVINFRYGPNNEYIRR